MIKVSERVTVKGSTLFSEFNGAFVENCAAQELVAKGQKDLYYWTSKMALSEIIHSMPSGYFY